ncbi:ERI1 exoribonuclease 2-like [Chlorella sorokiniana]|uniref:ERI1 exoribonuclease 2-like n=1 Tax=Chlorella sorokiniana TaxID=3076 RepID=A0A2P6TN34_CHLSO|nr:ERI1 exoribonuclease 2-like [Chlorella sorokiniana]|eukprot:PRW45744.1 ERI1 exoribonuclease 2-like [Chlorella sorokiniana]
MRSTAAAEAGGAAAQPKRKLKQLFDFLLVYDLEATCDADKSKQPQPQEIIELSCVAVETATLRLLPSTFQRYVKPDQHPVLTQFCTELTGITQDMVDAGVPLREALAQHEAWLREQGILGKGRTCVPVTWRDWDLKVMMAMETKWRGIEQPKYLKRWVDLSAVVFKHSKARGNLRASVEAAGLQWEGRAHSAIDDARNTARLAIKLMLRGVILGITGSFSGVDASGRFKQATLQLGGGSASGSVKPSSGGGGAAGSGPASGAGTGRASGGTGGARSSSGGLGYGFGAQQQQPAKKKKIYDAEGAWNGCCFCGVRAKKRQVKRPGPNNGREFWSCGKFSMTGGGPTCEFFKFTSDIAAPPPAAKKQR